MSEAVIDVLHAVPTVCAVNTNLVTQRRLQPHDTSAANECVALPPICLHAAVLAKGAPKRVCSGRRWSSSTCAAERCCSSRSPLWSTSADTITDYSSELVAISLRFSGSHLCPAVG